jgi:hypothetical protein
MIKVYKFIKVLLPVLVMTAGLVPSQTFGHGIHKAAIHESYNSRIIDDVLFIDSNAMSEAAIQAFLQAKVPACRTGYVCLKDYVDPTVQKKASKIIFEEAQRIGLSPMVILVTLQKEQSLVTDDFPYDSQYRTAMGYGCPESQSVCDSQYYGFYNQVRLGSTLLRVGHDRNCGNTTSFPGWSVNTKWKRGNTTTVDGKATYMETCPTGSLMNYTPHRPDSGYLSAGDGSHYYGNYNFIYFFTAWFRPTQIDDTMTAHPDGSLVALENKIWLIYEGKRRHVMTPAVFNSYFYQWREVKRATTGDYGLQIGSPVSVLRPGTLFRTPTSSVYVMEWDGSAQTWKKQLVTYAAFISLGYRWDEVQVIPESELPSATMGSPLAATAHPHGTLVRSSDDPRVYMIEHGTRRHLTVPEVLYSHNRWWTDIKTATAADSQLPLGAVMPFREGKALYDGSNLYVVEVPPTGNNLKRPIGPWSCFAEKLKYTMGESISLPTGHLPNGTGGLITC